MSGPSTEVKVLDVYPDGHLPADDDAEDAGSAVFPSLPPSTLAMPSTWKTQTNPIQEQNYQVLQNDGKEFIESTHSSGLMDQVYLQKSSAKIHFDRERGVVTAIDETDAGDYTHPSKNSASTRLLSLENISVAALRQLSADADLMNQVEKEDQDLWTQDRKEGGKSQQKVGEQSKALLLVAASRVKTESIKTHLTGMAQEIAEDAADNAKDDAQQANLIGKPSPDWQSTDLDGHKHSLAAYRGKVLLLDFWFRGCEPCMMAMPQVKQIAKEYKDKGVVTLASSMDNQADAKFVGKIFGLPFPIVCSGEILMAYGIHDFPTLMIIDQRGIVRSFEIGCSKDTVERLKKEIDALLRTRDSQMNQPRPPKALPPSADSI